MTLDSSRFRQNRLYHDLAHLWPVISPPSDYAAEARDWIDILREKLGPGRHPVLELGVGGGHNLSHFAGELAVTAVDLSEEMLAHSRRLNPGVDHRVGDMRDVRLERRFRAVLIHDAVSYLTTEDDLRATIRTAAAHLEPGGLLIMAPDWLRETFRPPKVFHTTRRRGDLVVTYVEYLHDPDPEDTAIEILFFFYIQRGTALRIEEDRHVVGLFQGATWTRLMREAGFAVEQRPTVPWEDGAGGALFVGVARETGEPRPECGASAPNVTAR